MIKRGTPLLRTVACIALSGLICSCGDKPAPQQPGKASTATTPASPPPPPPPAPAKADHTPKKFYWTEQLLHVEIKFHNPHYEGDAKFEIEDGDPLAMDLRGRKVERIPFMSKLTKLTGLDISETQVGDLRPLKGLQLQQLFLEKTPVVDLTPLRGMPLQNLALSNTQVSDLSGLEGAPLVELRAVETKIGDLSPLATSPLQSLWLTGSPVEGIASLKGMPLVTLTLHRTKVRDLSPLAGSSLQRLHMGETPAEDLTPLKGLPLTRLVFTPANIKTGMEVARALPLQEIGTKFDDEGKDLTTPDVFWPALDAAKPVTK